MAPNHHPDHAQTLANNARAFFRKSGMGATMLDNGKTAVSRKSNELMERSRVGTANSRVASRGGMPSSSGNNVFNTGSSANRII